MLRKALFTLTLLVAPALAQAQNLQPDIIARLEQRTAEIVAVLNEERDPAETFTDDFNAAVPPAQLQRLMEQITNQFGPLLAVEGVTSAGHAGAASVTLRFASGLAKGQVQLEADEPYKVAGFRLTDFVPVGDNVQDIRDELTSLPGEVTVLFTPLGAGPPLLDYGAGEQMAIGSTMKLYVLSALARSIQAGQHSWDEVVPLSVQSFSSGQLQDWPQGSPLTLHTLAAQMISISDNTATDQLIAVLGRNAVEAELRASGHADPSATLPFMTTREMFLLKSSAAPALNRYSALAPAGRRAMLDALSSTAADKVDVERTFGGGPRALNIEWFASGQDIARIFQRLTELDDTTALDILAINPSLTGEARAKWDYVGFKGGSEPGVLNLSWLLRDKADSYYVLSMSWNNPDAPVDHQQFELISQRVLGLLSPADE